MFPFNVIHSELENILGDKKCMNPDYVLDSESISGKVGKDSNLTELSEDSGK